jgi:hypothetical protein
LEISNSVCFTKALHEGIQKSKKDYAYSTKGSIQVHLLPKEYNISKERIHNNKVVYSRISPSFLDLEGNRLSLLLDPTAHAAEGYKDCIIVIELGDLIV